jgi:hypothetical protein
MQRLPMIARSFAGDVLFDADVTRFTYVLLLVFMAACPRVSFGELLGAPSCALLTVLVGYLLVFAGTPAPPEWHWLTAGTRVFSQISPAVMLWLGLALAQILPHTGRRTGHS